MTKTTWERLYASTFVLIATTIPSIAEEVTLSDLSGDTSIAGELLDFDGTRYTVRTILGDLTVDASLMRCEGTACPVTSIVTSEFRVSGSKRLSKHLMPNLISGYGVNRLGTVGLETQVEGQSGSASYQIASASGGIISAVNVSSSNTTEGFSDLLQGETAIALASRPARYPEARSFEDAGFGDIRSADNEHILALDGLLLVTSPQNPVGAITEQNAALAFAGQITNWSELGGPDAPINIYVRDGDAGPREVFDDLLMRPTGLTLSENTIFVKSDEALSKVVALDPNGLGFTSFAEGDGAKVLAIEGVCGLKTPANAFTIKTEEYPLTQLFYMYNANQQLPAHAKGLLDFVKSDDAQDMISEAGFINHSILEGSIDKQGLRIASAMIAHQDFTTFPLLQEMTERLIGSDRLSTTFRFETGSDRLDNRAQEDIVRLAELLSSDAYRNKEAMFVGFTDSVGDRELNRQLSRRRAQQVVQELLAENPDLKSRVAPLAIGYGEISPLGCNETNTGRRINRRVEVWVRDIVARN